MMRLPWISAALVGLWANVAYAQSEDKPPFYDSNPETEEDRKGTAFSGNITSTSFYFAESGNQTVEGIDGAQLQNASPTSRVFSELRIQLRADHISGGKFDFKLDVRGRQQFEKCKPREAGTELLEECLPSQSGLFGGQERDVREVYVNYRDGGKLGYQLRVGRQFMTEIGAIKFDGVRFEKSKSKELKYLAFAGAYPTRGSRDYRADYPKVLSDPLDPASDPKRLIPIVAGAGASYRKPKLYGSIGVAGIIPQGKDVDGLDEDARVLVSSNGYWQQSETTDIFHNVVIDAAGAAGAGVSLIAIGASHRPSDEVSLFAYLTRVDTETLNVQAQVRLDTLDENAAAATKVQNNWYVSRVAQESIRAGASSSFGQRRFQLTASGALRRRPEIVVRQNNFDPLVADTSVTLEKAQAVDINLQFVDRHSFKDARISASVTRSFDIGKEGNGLDRAKSTLGTLSASRELSDGKGEVELNFNFVQSADQKLEETCGIGAQFLECFGTSKSQTFGLGALVFYRPATNWFALGMVSASSQTLTTNAVAGDPVKQPAVLMLTGFARLAYRF